VRRPEQTRPTAKSTGERIQKALARSDWGSRREIERLIRDRRIKVNNSLAVLGLSIRPGDSIQLDNGRIVEVGLDKQELQVLLYHKPAGVVCTRSDEEGRPTIFEKLPRVKHGRWLNVGRLDINTTGLLLFTNNGELAHRLTHPKYKIDREYAVRVFGNVNEKMLLTIRKVVEVDGDVYSFSYGEQHFLIYIPKHTNSVLSVNFIFGMSQAVGKFAIIRKQQKTSSVYV
jgi:23S rRNA pseudouridine2605 synthase